jgi:hypothetical protein
MPTREPDCTRPRCCAASPPAGASTTRSTGRTSSRRSRVWKRATARRLVAAASGADRYAEGRGLAALPAMRPTGGPMRSGSAPILQTATQRPCGSGSTSTASTARRCARCQNRGQTTAVTDPYQRSDLMTASGGLRSFRRSRDRTTVGGSTAAVGVYSRFYLGESLTKRV